MQTIKSEKIDVHKWQHKIDLLYAQLQTDLSKSNFELIKKYDRQMVNEGTKKATRFLHLSRLLSLSRRLNKDWKNATKEDIENVIYEIMDIYSDEGKDSNYTYDHKKVLRIFFRWFKLGYREQRSCIEEKGIGDPIETRKIRMRKPKSKLKSDDLISEQEREWILDACQSSRDKALIDMSLDGGIRPGELLSLRIRNVKQDKHGYVVTVEGKTGIRPVRLVQCTPSLARWLSEHPFKEQSSYPLWINLEKTKYGQPLAYSATRAMLGRVSKKVKEKYPEFDKRVFLNLFRHTEATNSAKYMSDAITKKRHGWSINSKSPSTYQHLINSDVDDIIFDHFGIEKSQKEKQRLPITCQVCQMVNPVASKMCSQCGKPLDLETALKIEERELEEKENTQTQLKELEIKFDNFKVIFDEITKRKQTS